MPHAKAGWELCTGALKVVCLREGTVLEAKGCAQAKAANHLSFQIQTSSHPSVLLLQLYFLCFLWGTSLWHDNTKYSPQLPALHLPTHSLEATWLQRTVLQSGSRRQQYWLKYNSLHQVTPVFDLRQVVTMGLGETGQSPLQSLPQKPQTYFSSSTVCPIMPLESCFRSRLTLI